MCVCVYIYIYIYIYIYMCVCVCVCVCDINTSMSCHLVSFISSFLFLVQCHITVNIHNVVSASLNKTCSSFLLHSLLQLLYLYINLPDKYYTVYIFFVVFIINYRTSRGMCYPVWGMMHIKEPVLVIGKSTPYSGGSGFPVYLSGPLPYFRRHITVNKRC